MREEDIDKFTRIMSELSTDERLFVLAYATAKLIRKKAIFSWLRFSWFSMRKRTFIVVDDLDLPAPRVIGL